MAARQITKQAAVTAFPHKMQMGYSWAEILLACLLFGHSVAENGFFGFFIFFVRQNLKVRNLRASVATANAQGAISAMLSIWMIYFGRYRARGLSRMILYAYSTYIAGMLLLWLSRFASTQFLILALVLITIGQAGERCLVHFFGLDWEDGPSFLVLAPILLALPPPPPPPRVPPRAPPPPPPPPPPSKDTTEKKEKGQLRTKVKLVFAKAPGAIIGAFYVSSLSWDQTFKFTALAMLAGYHIFFWFGPKIFYSPVNTIEEENEELEIYKQELEIYKKKLEIYKKKHGAIRPPPHLDDQLKKATLLYQLKEAIRVLGSGRLVSLWLTFAFTCNLVSATGNTFFIAQIGYLVNNTKQSFRISESTFYFVVQNFTTATSLGCDYLIIKLNGSKDRRKQWPVRLFRIVIGMFFSFLCCMVACLVEGRRSDSGSNSISVFWLVPQYLLLGLMRGIGNDGLSGFLSDCVSKTEKNKIIAVCAVAEVCGNIISAVLASVSPSSWIGTDMGRSNLYNYYRMLAFISLCFSVLFVIVVSGFKLLDKYPTGKDEVSEEQRPNAEF